ncbi:MAG: HSP20 family protein [Myxococcota bacterium]|jgi:HSP20 family protein
MSQHRLNTRVPVTNYVSSHPFHDWPLGPLQWRGSQAFTAPQQHENAQASHALSPPVDIRVNEKAYALQLELAGIAREDVSVTFHENVLTVKGEKKRPEIVEGDQFPRAERRFGSFERSFRLPEDAEHEQMRANYRDGVLSIEIPKLAPSAPQEIEIEV